MELSNKTMIYCISIAILIILFGTAMSLTKLQKVQNLAGLVTSGSVNITIATTAAINVSQDTINWSSGQVSQGFSSATLDTNNETAYVKGGTWSSAGIKGFTLQNIGNVPVNITINSTEDNSSYIGGTGPQFRFEARIATGNSSACEAGLLSGQKEFERSNRTRICNVFNYTVNRDHLIVDINISIPENAPSGSKNTTIRFNACDVSSGSCAA